MSGFVATADATDQTITNDGFWPDVDPDVARDAQRIDGTVSASRLREALIDAIGSVNAELDVWKAAQVALGYATLDDVPAPNIGGTSRFVNLYQRAVRCTAAANVSERYRDFSATADAQKKADEQAPIIDDLRRDARWAIRDLMGTARSTVELI